MAGDLSDTERLRRFLLYGRDDGIYLGTDRLCTFNRNSTGFIDRLIGQSQGQQVMDMITECSREGRRLWREPLMYVLAICSLSNDVIARQMALRTMPQLCRNSTPTSFFMFVNYRIQESKRAGNQKGWGRCMRKAVANYYNSFADDPLKLALHVTKYRSRRTWRHCDILRLAHVKPCDCRIGFILAYVAKGLNHASALYPQGEGEDEEFDRVRDFLEVVEFIRREHYDQDTLCKYIAEKQLVREHLPTRALTIPEVWEALLFLMPMKCLLRNLGKLASLQLFGPDKLAENLVLNFLRNEQKIIESKIHPIDVLVARHQYCQGTNIWRRFIWEVRETINLGLDHAFHLALGNVDPTGKRYFVAIDLGSRHNDPVNGVFGTLTVGKLISAIVLALLKREENCQICQFGTGNVVPVIIDRNSRLDEIENLWQRGVTFNGPNASLPIEYALQNNVMVDVFVVISAGNPVVVDPPPVKKLREYRQNSGLNGARLAFVNMLGNNLTVRDPGDHLMVDFMGIGANILTALQEFSRF